MTTNPRRIAALSALVLAALTARTLAAPPAPPSSPGLERFKSLAGAWVAAEDGPMSRKGDLVARYAVSAAGTAGGETGVPGPAPERGAGDPAARAARLLPHHRIGG